MSPKVLLRNELQNLIEEMDWLSMSFEDDIHKFLDSIICGEDIDGIEHNDDKIDNLKSSKKILYKILGNMKTILKIIDQLKIHGS